MMMTIDVNHELQITCTEGFHVMEDGERDKLNFYGEGEFECFSDPERHIIICVGWKNLTGLTATLVNAAMTAKSMEKKISRPMRRFGYRKTGTKDILVGGEPASGYCYEYEVQDIAMAGESYACKRGSVMYYLHAYYRKALEEDSVPIWMRIVDSMRWIDEDSEA